VEARFSAPVQKGHGGHPASYTEVTVSFLGVKWQRVGVDHPPLSSADVKERVVIILLSLWDFMACWDGGGDFTFLFTSHVLVCKYVV